ncbi:helicase-related protein [Geodermatophilus sp. URMC 62]|uniref:helicase-related protein n=1 Tax=Geodermatophilus sp. URMC 62 TaxID=3423414 RepID=UPI00406C0C21
MTGAAARGFSRPNMRLAECKDCRREVVAGLREEGSQFFTYPESWADGQLQRGGSRSDRCREHRQKHKQHIAGVAVAYIDLATIGEVSDRSNPTGPLGGLGPLPEAHRIAEATPVDLGTFGFGMDESHVGAMLESLADPERRVLVVKAGTGTGKSTYMPYRLLDPPEGAFRLTHLGPIVVTEPRVQATVGVAEFVGKVMSGAGGVGPGYPVGFQVSGNRNHDPACQLVYVTDGTMINWLREGRLSQIGTVIVDEAHERSTNIDFIMGYLKRELPRYPHLRVIITSATFDADFYQQFFGGPRVAGKIVVPAVKSIGYGWPLFPELDVPPEGAGSDFAEKWSRMAPELALGATLDEGRLVSSAWPRTAPPLKDSEVRDPLETGYEEDLHDTTRKLLPLRFHAPIPVKRWKDDMPKVLGNYVVKLAKGLDRAGIFGDILGFLPTGKGIEEACDIIRAGVGGSDVYALLSSLPTEDKENALAARRKGDKRKIVVSTNLAETSLTVEGVRFVVDSGLIAQSEWDPGIAQGGIKTKAHSQAGIKQRWGRVGRKAPGWVFPLYTKDQLLELAEDTAPGSTRDNLEQLVMTAKLGGVDDVVNFPWPAAFQPEPPVLLDQTAKDAREVFLQELVRANEALRGGGALDSDGDPTSFGKELTRFQALGSTAAAIAILYADRLACVPEVATILALLNGTQLAGANKLLLDLPTWPDEWRLEAYERHRALASACEDEAELALQVTATWERADPAMAPWEPSQLRQAWARRWWINDELLRAAAEQRRDILAALSPAMKEEVKRFVEPALLRRSRGAISRAFASLAHQDHDGSGRYYADLPDKPVGDLEDEPAHLDSALLPVPPRRVIPLTRRRVFGSPVIGNLVAVEPWALPESRTHRDGGPEATGNLDAMRLLALSADFGRADETKDVLGATLDAWPAGQRVQLRFAHGSTPLVVESVDATLPAAQLPVMAAAATAADRAVAVDLDVGLDAEGATNDSATVEDASPELDTNWPTSTPPIEDTEAQQRRAVLDHREVEAEEAACGACRSCVNGQAQDCVNPARVDLATAADVLEAWRNRATTGVDVSRPRVRLSGEEPPLDGAWYEVVGYEIAPDRSPIVLVRPDWRPEGHVWGPGKHPDLHAGQHIEVVVGTRLRDHRDELLVLNRTDGLGRFVVREAHTSPDKQEQHGQLAISLSRRHQGRLRQLRGVLPVTVIPRQERNHYTVSFLEVLHQHLMAVGEESAKRFEVSLRDGRTIELPFYPAVVTGQPNGGGYIPVELLSRDDRNGLGHDASFFVDEGEIAPSLGDPVYVRLNRESARISLNGRSLHDVRALVDAERTLFVSSEDDEDATDEFDQDADVPAETTAEVGSYTTYLISRGAVPRAAMPSLLALDDSPEWQRDVWLFWARSRHVRTDRQDAYRPGTSTNFVHSPAVLMPELPPAPQLTVDEALELYPRGSMATATVTRVRDDMGRAWLKLSDGTEASLGARDVDTGGQPLSALLFRGLSVEGRVLDVGEHRGAIQVRLTLRSETTPGRPPTPTLAEAETTYRRGAVVEAVVDRVRDDLGRAWLRLADGLQATVGSGDVGPAGVLRIGSALREGDRVSGRVRGVSERNGVPQVQLELKELRAPTMWEQLDDAGLREDVTVPGRVANVVDALGVFVELRPGLNGLVHRSKVDRPLGSFVRGESCAVRITSISEDRKRPGRVNVQLELA